MVPSVPALLPLRIQGTAVTKTSQYCSSPSRSKPEDYEQQWWSWYQEDPSRGGILGVGRIDRNRAHSALGVFLCSASNSWVVEGPAKEQPSQAAGHTFTMFSTGKEEPRFCLQLPEAAFLSPTPLVGLIPCLSDLFIKSRRKDLDAGGVSSVAWATTSCWECL